MDPKTKTMTGISRLHRTELVAIRDPLRSDEAECSSVKTLASEGHHGLMPFARPDLLPDHQSLPRTLPSSGMHALSQVVAETPIDTDRTLPSPRPMGMTPA